jgi:hypothetical protein
MARQRNHDPAACNANVAVAAMTGQHTVHAIAATYGVPPNPVLPGQKPALAVVPAVCSSRPTRAAQDDDAWQARLYQPIGPRKVARDWRKKTAGFPTCVQAARDRTSPRADQWAATRPVTRGEACGVVLPGG